MVDSQGKLKQMASQLPESPGVYKFFGPKNKLLYIGKATSIKNRVRSYFSKDLEEKRSPLISKMMGEAKSVKFEKTASVLEALILEARLIKKFTPPYNTADKDQKSWNFVVVTEEKFPRVLLVRERELTSPPDPLSLPRRVGTKTNTKIKEKFGPFTNSGQLREALKIVRKIFPFRDKCLPGQGKPCFNRQIGLCPGVCTGEISEKDYIKNINRLIKFFRGEKTKIITEMESEMKSLAKERKFEEAGEIKRKKFALKHIEDIALIKRAEESNQKDGFRIEAYDIAHISGSNMVGVMTVVDGGEANKSEYRMFKIKGQTGIDDTKALKEILERRFKHKEWRFPDLVAVDGGKAQLGAATSIISKLGIKTMVAAVTKDERHKPKEVIGETANRRREILLANSEAHRFAVKYHRKLRENYGK